MTTSVSNTRSRSATAFPSAPAAPPASSGGYKIKSGDTLSGIAKQLGVSTEQLLAANPQIKDANKILAGATLNLPAATGAGQPAATPATKDQYARGQTPALLERRTTGSQPQVAADPHARQALTSEFMRARLGGVGVEQSRREAQVAAAEANVHHDAATTHDTAGAPHHGAAASDGHGDGHAHVINNVRDGRTNDVKADGHTTGTHLGDTSHMPLGKTILHKSTDKNAHGPGDAHGGGHHGPEVGANATLFAVHSQSQWTSALGKSGTIGHDPTNMEDKTGAAGEVHFLAARHSAGAAVGVDLKKGQIIAGGDASAQVDLIGASGQAQVGSSNTVLGQAYVKGEAHVGARAAVGGGVTIDPRKDTVKLSVGGEAFAGAEAKAATGYQNRYIGVEAEVRGQAGIGGAASASIGLEKGVFKAKADLGACVGLGGRITVNVNVNVGAMAADAYSAASSAASSGWNTVKSWF